MRVGPGIQIIGKDQYKHVFDGLAILHKFTIKNGKVNCMQCISYKGYRGNTYIIFLKWYSIGHIPKPCPSE